MLVSDPDPDNPYASSDASDYEPQDIEDHFVQLTSTDSTAEASALAARLREAGIIALANAVPYYGRGDTGPSGIGAGLIKEYHTCVMVFAADEQRAIELFHAEFSDEGSVSNEVIEQEMRDAAEDPDAATAWYYNQKSGITDRAVIRWAFAAGLTILIIWWLLN